MIYYLFFGPDDYFYVQGWCSVQDLCPFRTIFWDVILGWYHDNLFTFFLSAESKKGKNCCGILFNEITQPFQSWICLKINFTRKLRKIIINFHPKISWYHPKITSQNIVPKEMNKFIKLWNSFQYWFEGINLRFLTNSWLA